MSRSATLGEGVSAEKEVGVKSCTHIAPWESCEGSRQDLLQPPTSWLHAQHSQDRDITIPVTSQQAAASNDEHPLCGGHLAKLPVGLLGLVDSEARPLLFLNADTSPPYLSLS